ncbi:hypothetical protein PFISCL1PPCAC_21122, partial [Pristionchus fissidentatus]
MVEVVAMECVNRQIKEAVDVHKIEKGVKLEMELYSIRKKYPQRFHEIGTKKNKIRSEFLKLSGNDELIHRASLLIIVIGGFHFISR